MQRHILSISLENEPGALSRVIGLFSGRGYNIESLNVAPSLESGISNMTITTRGESQIVEQIIKQLRKVITVIKVVDLTDMQFVEREMAMIKVSSEGSKRAEILRITDIFRCKVVDVGETSLTIEITGCLEKIRPVVALLQRFGIKEYVRTGAVVMRRGMQLDDEFLS